LCHRRSPGSFYRERSKELLLGLHDQKGHLQYISSVGIDAKQKQQVGMLRPKKTTPFYDRPPGEKSHWSGEAVGPWKPVSATKVVEVRYNHFSDQRFRHGCTFLRMVSEAPRLDPPRVNLLRQKTRFSKRDSRPQYSLNYPKGEQKEGMSFYRSCPPGLLIP
jgi:hypothetical protein